jgi:hypothetical protein
MEVSASIGLVIYRRIFEPFTYGYTESLVHRRMTLSPEPDVLSAATSEISSLAFDRSSVSS